MQTQLALEIKTPQAWRLLCSLIPHFNELDETENLGNFFLIDVGDWALASPATVREHWDHIETGDLGLKLVVIKE